MRAFKFLIVILMVFIFPASSIAAGTTATASKTPGANKVPKSKDDGTIDPGWFGTDLFPAIKTDATTSATGVVELATDAETLTGTATDKVTTPANIAAKLRAPGTIGEDTPGPGNFTSIDASGNIDAAGGFFVNGTPVGTSSDSYWSSDGGTGITYTAGPILTGGMYRGTTTTGIDDAITAGAKSVELIGDITLTEAWDLSAFTGRFSTNGHQISGAFTFTAPPDFIGSDNCFGSTVTVAGLKNVISPDWFGVNTTPGTTDMAAALNAAINSGTVVVDLMSRTYATASALTASTANVTIRNGTIVYTGTAGSAPSGVTILTVGADNVTLDNLTLDGNYTASVGVRATKAAYAEINGFRMFNCTVKDIYGDTGYNGGYGIYLDSPTDFVIRGCVIDGVGGTPNTTVGDSIGAPRAILIGGSIVTTTGEITGCTIDRVGVINTGTGVLSTNWGEDGDSIHIITAKTGDEVWSAAYVHIKHNIIHNAPKRAIKLQASNVVVDDNYIYGMDSGAGLLGGLIELFGTDCRVVNNNIHDGRTGTTYGIYHYRLGNYVWGNVVTGSARKNQPPYHLYVDPVGGDDTNTGTSELTPIKTLAFIASNVAKIQTTLGYWDATTVHLADGDYTGDAFTLDHPLDCKFSIVGNESTPANVYGLVFNLQNINGASNQRWVIPDVSGWTGNISTVGNFTVAGVQCAAIVSENSKGVTFSGCELVKGDTYALYVYANSNVALQANDITCASGTAIYVADSSVVDFYGTNTIHDSTLGIHAYYGGTVRCAATPTFTSNTTKVTLTNGSQYIAPAWVESHDYGAGTTAWTLTAWEASTKSFATTNAGGGVNAILPAGFVGTFHVSNTSGQTVTWKYAASTGVANATAKKAILTADGTEVYAIKSDY